MNPMPKATAGYSGTPLAKKLGIKADHRLLLVRAPDGFRDTLAPLPPGVVVRTQARATADVIVFFATRTRDLDRLEPLARRLDPAGGLWVGWPKKASGVATELAFDAVRTAGLSIGLVDNKVCAIDDTWSGLRFVVRREDRPSRSKR